MKRVSIYCAIFTFAVVIGAIMTVGIAPPVLAGECILDQYPQLVLSCDTGPYCEYPTPYYTYQTGRDSSTGELCLIWYGCSAICP